MVASGGDEPVRVGERERSRGGDEHGGEWERVEGSAWRRLDASGMKQAGRRWPGHVLARASHALVLLARARR